MLNGDDLRRRPLVDRKAALRKLLGRGASRGGIQYVAHIEGDGEVMFAAVCKHRLEGIVSKKLDAPYRSGRSKAWIKVKNPKAPAATRVNRGNV
jgi:bifunctional non-homologous end joining protein LigD